MLAGGTRAELRWVLWPRVRTAAVAATCWIAVQALTEVTVTDLMMVRTFTEEVYYQLVGNPVGVSAAVAVTLPVWLGSAAVAVWLAARVNPRALVIASGFTSVPDLGAQVYPFLPVRLISRFSYDSLGAIGSIKAPVLVAHSREDDIIPFAHGKALYDAAQEPKRFLEMRGGHNDGFIFMRQEWIAQLAAFLESARAGKPEPATTDQAR